MQPAIRVPTDRCTLRTSASTVTGRRVSMASARRGRRCTSSGRSVSAGSPSGAAPSAGAAVSVASGTDGRCRIRLKSRPAAGLPGAAGICSRQSHRPTASASVRKPSAAKCSRTSPARKRMKAITCSGRPAKFRRSSGSCVATPTGQVLRLHWRIMTQPRQTSTVVAKPNSSAPSSAAITTSRPVLSWPSTCRRTRPRSPLSSRVCCVSASPSSQGAPAWRTEVSGEAPVPPS